MGHGPTIVVRLAAQLYRRAARLGNPDHGGGVWIGCYWSRSPREAYRDICRSYRMARSGRLHGGAGPYGVKGPAAWEEAYR